MNTEKESKRIALFMLPLLTQGGGAEKYFIELARNLSAMGYRTDIITLDENFFRKFAKILHILTRGNFFGKIDTEGRESETEIIKRLRGAAWKKVPCKNLKKTFDAYDVIYSKNEVVDLLLLKLKGYKKIPPIIVGVHTPLVYPETISLSQKLHNFLYSSFFYKWLLKGTKYVHVSNRSAKELVEKDFGIDCFFIPYPFSVTELHKLAKNNRSDIHFDLSKRNIIFLGRLSEQKGVDTLINILKKTSENKDLQEILAFNIFGSGDEMLEKEIKNLSENYSFIHYFGHVENIFIPDILSQHDFSFRHSRGSSHGRTSHCF
jgi:glycosyltransferase involved in cell wall biosynthesis